MSLRIFTILAIAAGLGIGAAVVAPPASAQLTSDRVEEELDRTDTLIQRAREVVSGAISDRPREMLGVARDLQHEARQAFADGRLLQAATRTRAAQQAAGRAVDLATAEIRLLDQVRHLIARNDDLSARAREVVAASGDREATRLLEAGLEQLRRGQRAFHDHQFRAAVRLSLFGRDLVLRAVRAAEGEAGLDEARVRDDIARTDEFLRAANDAPREARRKLEEARRLQDRAEGALRDRHLTHARRLTLQARELVLDALRLENTVPDAADVTAHIERVEGRYRNVAGTISGARGREQRLLGEARDHLDEARQAAARDELRRALAEAQLANSLLDQIESR